MASSLLEILRSVPVHRRREGQRFELATVLLYAILGMVAGANSYRQLYEFIRAHRRRLNEAFNLSLRSFAYNMLRAAGCENIKNARWRAALDLNLVLAMPGL